MSDYTYDLIAKFPDLNENVINELNEFIKRKVYDSVDIIEIDPRNVYVAKIDTGMMPKPKAEKYIQDWLKLFKQAVEATGEETTGNIIATAYSSQSNGVDVIKLAKNKANIVYYDAGMMSDDKLPNHTERYKQIEQELNEKGYTVKFARKHRDEILLGIADSLT
jgi:hypothetical protein